MRAIKRYDNGGKPDPRARGSIYEGKEGNARQYEAARRARQMLGPLWKAVEEGMSEEEYNAKVTDKAYDLMDQEHRLNYESTGTENLLERLRDYKDGGSVQGGKVDEKGYSMEVAGAKAQGPVQSSDEGEQYVSMELPNGEVATVFGDWESYGNPSREGVIADMNYRIVPLGDGTYSLDVEEMESIMVRDEVKEFGEQATGGPGASRMEDLMEKLSDHKGPSKFAVRAARRQR
tara:strand:+ start:99 stop:797 length:699 start_codon:yes stop_codon:yes gene_type:complete